MSTRALILTKPRAAAILPADMAGRKPILAEHPGDTLLRTIAEIEKRGGFLPSQSDLIALLPQITAMSYHLTRLRRLGYLDARKARAGYRLTPSGRTYLAGLESLK